MTMRALEIASHCSVWCLTAPLCRSFREQCTQTLDEFRRISSTLQQQPKGIEELTELREFMNDIPTKLEALAVNMKATLHIFDVLETFKYRVTRALQLQLDTANRPVQTSSTAPMGEPNSRRALPYAK